ncbi:hypothetical protein [Phocaeicola sp.]
MKAKKLLLGYYKILSYGDLLCLLVKDVIKYILTLGQNKYQIKIVGNRIRSKEIDRKVYVCIHEWGGYPLIREKELKNGCRFICGLAGQLNRFEEYRRRGLVSLTLTMSDSEMFKDLDLVKEKVDFFLEVSNIGMDFSGYSAFYEQIKSKNNAYVILSNTSVDIHQYSFLDGYIDYMENNLDVAALGISYSTKMYQTVILDNFNPHIQSFFILTTIEILNNIVKANRGIFPGCKSINKRLLIRDGEIKLSTIILDLGYNIAIVDPITNMPFKFKNLRQWDKPLGDLRMIIKHPNRITPINC